MFQKTDFKILYSIPAVNWSSIWFDFSLLLGKYCCMETDWFYAPWTIFSCIFHYFPSCHYMMNIQGIGAVSYHIISPWFIFRTISDEKWSIASIYRLSSLVNFDYLKSFTWLHRGWRFTNCAKWSQAYPYFHGKYSDEIHSLVPSPNW